MQISIADSTHSYLIWAPSITVCHVRLLSDSVTGILVMTMPVSLHVVHGPRTGVLVLLTQTHTLSSVLLFFVSHAMDMTHS
jgi:hypothetical protein